MMASLRRAPLPLWQAEYDRRKTLGQVGWRNRTQTWGLTPWNSLSFEDSDTVRPIYGCTTCGGHGYVDRPHDESDIEAGSEFDGPVVI